MWRDESGVQSVRLSANQELWRMKGPGLRLSGDVRRVWRCPACGSERPSGGNVTSLRCGCEKPKRFMQLVEPRRNPRREQPPRDVYFECDPDDQTDAPPLVDETAVPEEQPGDALPEFVPEDDFTPDPESEPEFQPEIER